MINTSLTELYLSGVDKDRKDKRKKTKINNERMNRERDWSRRSKEDK